MLNRFVGSLSVFTGTSVKLDYAELNLRLLLTEKVILDTHRLAELNDLIRAFGVSGLMALLEEGKLSLTCEAFSFGFRDDLARRDDEFIVQTFGGVPEQRDWYLRRSFRDNVRADSGVDKLSSTINRYIEEPPGAESDHEVRRHLHDRVLHDRELVSQAIVMAGKTTGLAHDLELATLDFDVQQSIPGKLAYQIRSNLPASLNTVQRRSILAGAISAIANTGLRLDEMRRHQALTESKDTDLPLLDAHTRFLERGLAKAQPLAEFRRVLTLTGAPVPTDGVRLGARKLIDVAKSTECVEFRHWLQTEATHKTDEEVRKYFRSWSGRMAGFLGGNVGKSLKFAVVNAMQMGLDAAYPGMQGGMALGALDAFLLDKLIKPGGPLVFLNQTYPSLFTKGQAMEAHEGSSSSDV